MNTNTAANTAANTATKIADRVDDLWYDTFARLAMDHGPTDAAQHIAVIADLVSPGHWSPGPRDIAAWVDRFRDTAA